MTDTGCTSCGGFRYLANGEIHVILTKGSKGVAWPAVFVGHTKVC